VQSKSIDDGSIGGRDRGPGRYRPAAGRDDDLAVVALFEPFDNRVAVETAALCLDGGDKTLEIFERMKRGLARIAQHMLLFAMGEGGTDQPMDRCADLADRLQFVLDDLRVGVERLKQVTVQATKIAVDGFPRLDLLDAIHRCRLTLVEPAGYLLAAQAHHRRCQVIA
jgi:hypothetical protein